MRFQNASPHNLVPFLKKFAPSQSGRMGYALVEGDIEIFAIEKCDCCDAEVRGANPVTIVKPRFGILSLVRKYGVEKSFVTDEGGCDEDGNFVCPPCYSMNENDKSGV
jgi:hypothetical protein